MSDANTAPPKIPPGHGSDDGSDHVLDHATATLAGLDRRECLACAVGAAATAVLPTTALPSTAQAQSAATQAGRTANFAHPWLTDRIVEAVASGNPPNRVSLTPRGLTVGLCGAVQHYRALVEKGGWPTVPDIGQWMEFDTDDPAVATLRHRLRRTGDLPSNQDNGQTRFDGDLAQAVSVFQARHGLTADGVVGPATLAELNVPANVRLATLVINIERARQWAKDYGSRFIAVNIAASRLHLIEDGESIFDTKVIVGRIDRTTPIIHSKITRIDYNPYWYCPDSIARRDLLPAIQTDPDYFWNNGIRVYDTFGPGMTEIPAEEIDWYTYNGLENLPYKFRQDPGPWNVLGPVRFMFDNNHSVYLHGTSNEDLFEKALRTFSSGCVRVDQAVDISAHLATQQDGWDVARVQRLIENYKTRSVTLNNPMPVHLIYRTAWVEHDGSVQFRPDIYDWDAVLDINWGHVANVPCVYGVRETAGKQVVQGQTGARQGG
ncbi:MAG: L,D-transpeptidase family protein [Pseudomonadota bacterium]